MAKSVQKKKRMIRRFVSVLVFLLAFNLLAIPLYIAVYSDFSFEPLQQLNAKISVTTMKIFGYDVDADGYAIELNSNGAVQKIDISWDSTGWKSMYAIAALIISTPTSELARKIKFALLGIGVIFVINCIRIITTISLSASYGFDLFNIVHTVLWREGLILAVVGLWIGWMYIEKYNIGKTK